jgi:hypothetical protein
MSYLLLRLFAHSGVKHILCSVFVLFFFVLFVPYIASFSVFFVVLCVPYIASFSVFFVVLFVPYIASFSVFFFVLFVPYIASFSVFFFVLFVPYIASFSGLSIFYCPFGILLRLFLLIKIHTNIICETIANSYWYTSSNICSFLTNDTHKKTSRE